MGENGNNNPNQLLPPGFRLYPTDEELVVNFLHPRTHPDIIPDLGLYPYDPWDLRGKALEEDGQWYYYSRRISHDQVTESGYWKPMGLDDEPILTSNDNHNSTRRVVGLKKYLTYFLGDVKTNWIMEEYRLPDSSSSSSSLSSSASTTNPCDSSSSRSRSTRSRSRMGLGEYSKRVICRVYERSFSEDEEDSNGTELSLLDEVFLSLDDDDDISFPN